MKRKYKITALLLVLLAFVSLQVPVHASGVKIEISEDRIIENHTFTAYQIFTGTQTGKDGDVALGDIVWGNGVDVKMLISALTDPECELYEDFREINFSEDEKVSLGAEKIAKTMESWQLNSGKPELFAKIIYSCVTGAGTQIIKDSTSLEAGYYLIVDTTEKTEDGSAYNAALLQVTGDTIRISLKTDAPSLEKKVKENIKYSEYNDTADYSIGDEIPFAIYSKVPDMSNYDSYLFEIHDTFGEGLTLLDDAEEGFVVTIGSKTLLRGTEYTVEKEGQSFVLKINDLKSVSGIDTEDAIAVKYSACLNEHAAAGSTGNLNEAYLVYSNNPNIISSTGKTPIDKTIIFTYGIEVLKVDANSFADDDYEKKLADAEFLFYKISNEQKEYALFDTQGKLNGWTVLRPETGNLKTSENGTFTILGFDDGVYYLEETKAPSGYNLLNSPVKITIEAETIHGQDGAEEENLSDLMVKADVNIMDDIQEETGAFGDVFTGIVNVTVQNQKGAVLPSTGGEGVIGLYVLGAGLIVVSFVYLSYCKNKNVKNHFN